MAARRVVTSAAAERRLAVAREYVAADRSGEILIIAPTRGAADDLVRTTAVDSGQLGIHRMSVIQLAGELATMSLARRGLVPVSALGVEALAARAIHAASRDAGLPFFAPVVSTPGFARALARTLLELRADGIGADRLIDLHDRGPDLARLMAEYERQLEERALIDTPGLLGLAAEAAADPAHRLLGLPTVMLDLSPSNAGERHLLARVAEHAPSLLATMPFEDAGAREALTSIAAAELETIVDDADDAHRLVRVRQHLFQSDVPPGGDDDPSVEFFSAPGEGRECVEIARRVVRLAAEGTPFDRVAILLRTPESYQALLEDALRRARIPAYFTRGTARPDPGGRALLALLACASEGLTASRFAEYLSLGQVPELAGDGAPPSTPVPWVEPEGEQLVFKTFEDKTKGEAEPAAPLPPIEEAAEFAGTLRTPSQWERLLVDAAVVGGRDRWERRLRGLRAELEAQRREAEGDEEPIRDRLERQLERLGHLERFALPIIGRLDRLPSSAPWGEWLQHLEELAVAALRRPQPALAMFAELAVMEEIGPVEIDEVREVLAQRLTLLRLEPPARRYGRVFVATLAEARGRAFDAVFVPGLAEGVFPRKMFEDPLLLDDDRAHLDGALTTRKRRVEEERLLLRVAAGCARRRLITSYPRIDSLQGRQRVPSFYALDLLRAADGELPALRELEKRAADASDSLHGWPAPRTTAEAIDDAEYDLALLRPLIRASGAEREGRARFLLAANPHLARSLRTRAARWRPRWTGADGIVDPDPETAAVLHAELPTERSYSPTALQTYAGCPYRFLLYAIHRLRTREQSVAIQQIDALTRGSLFHEIQAELLRSLDEKDMLPPALERLDELLDHADSILDRVASEWAERLAPAIPRIWASEMESLRTDLRIWLRKVAESGPRWRPTYFELAFGLPLGPDRDPRSQKEPVVILDRLLLRGSIDLVEVDEAEGILRVTDHKTGKGKWSSRLVIDGGETLQPVLYGLAAEQVLGRPARIGRLYYCTQRGEYRTVDVDLDEHARKAAIGVLSSIERAIRDGFLPAAPKEKACNWCDFRVVCGPYEEIRVKSKRKDERIAELNDLRRRE